MAPQRPSRVSNPYKRNRTANSCRRTRGTWIASLLYFSGTGTIPRPDTTVGVKGKPHNGLVRLWLAFSGRQEGSSPAPRPECSLRLEKVSKVTPVRESKLTSEGCCRQSLQKRRARRPAGGNLPVEADPNASHKSVQAVMARKLARMFSPNQRCLSPTSRLAAWKRGASCPKTLGKLCGTQILHDCRTRWSADDFTEARIRRT